MLAEAQHVASDLCYNLALVLGPAVLQHVLDHVVTILVLEKAHTHTHTVSDNASGHQPVALILQAWRKQMIKTG